MREQPAHEVCSSLECSVSYRAKYRRRNVHMPGILPQHSENTLNRYMRACCHFMTCWAGCVRALAKDRDV